jgi:signal transduction histidine kinase
MIDQLLDFTRVRVGSGIAVERKAMDLLPLLRQVIEELELAHPQWLVRLSAAGRTAGEWDPDRLAQVFSNLIANALQHGVMERGVDVTIESTQLESVTVHVRNGGAIAPELLPTLFEPMTGVRRGQKSQGLGLGLYISQQIVLAHGGRLEVCSDNVAGTTFSVHLEPGAAAWEQHT